MDNDLLPVGSEAPRCSEFAKSLQLRPAGSGLFLERVVLVSVPLPWPKPALRHVSLEAAAVAVQHSAVTSRLFAAEPQGATPFVEVYERSGASTSFYRWHVDTPDAERVVTEIAATSLGELDVLSTPPTKYEPNAPITFLVCTQGSHDTCCGTTGVALADEIQAARDYEVRRVSHTGGHRFSPTFLSFPHGRMWAFADLNLVDRIATDTTTREDHEHHSRGWWGAKVGPAQAAECAVQAELAATNAPVATAELTPLQNPSAPEAIPGGVGTNSIFDVAVGDSRWLVNVSVGRTVPSIACEAPGGLPAKPGREFSWTIETAPRNPRRP